MSKRWTKKITVVAETDPQAPDGVAFHMEDENGDELLTLDFSKDQIQGMMKNDNHEVRFKLNQESGMTLEFAQSPSDALWVAWGTETTYPPCPKTKPSTPDTIFYAEKSNGNTLVAVNTNPAVCLFSFTLNFVDPNSSTPTKLIPYDPGGGNQDGGTPPFQNVGSFTAYLVIALVSAAVAAFATYGLMR